MDDCNLDKLGVKPGKLEPAFKRDITEYNITVASDVEKISFDPLTSDTGASYSISGGEGGKQVPLPEGTVTDIKIEVTAEDGTTKKYFIHARRLSAKDATLSTLKLSMGKLDPEFAASTTEYSCLLPCNITSLTVTPTAPDTKNAITVCGEKPGSPTPLNVGETQVPVEVTSADGSNKQTYTVTVMKKQLPRYVKLTDPKMALQYECPISLSPLYRPITIKNSDPRHTFSAPLIDEYTKTSKFDPLNSMPLGTDWRVMDYALDSKLSSLDGCIPLTYGGASEVMKYRDLGASIEKYSVAPKTEDLTDRFKGTTVTINHTVEVRKWEKGLQQVFDETDVKELVKNAKAEVEKYFESLPKPGESKQYAEGESPIDFLNHATYCYATAIKFKAKDPDLHLQLGMVLEERYIAEDLFGLKKEDRSDIPSLNVQAKESSKEEEAQAIAKLRGVDATAPISLQLKAIDQEYHHLIDTGQSGKADHVMALYAWYSKKASQEGAAALKAENDGNPLGQAYMKYMDALTLDDTKAMLNFHVGRLLVVQGNYEDAVKRLEVTLNWNAKHQLARIYLGLALALQKGGPGSRAKEAITYLQEAMETLLTENSKFAMSYEEYIVLNSLHAENLIRLTNVHLLRALIQLGRLLAVNPDVKDSLSAQDVFHNAALLSSQVLPTLCRGDTYKQVEWVLLDAHSHLLQAASQSGEESVIAQRCERLSALIVHSTIPQNSELLNLQERTCQQLVQIQPCSSPALYILGAAQFAKFENSPPGEGASKLLEDAKASFKSCMELEGKPASGEPGEMLTGQQWWQEKLKAEEEKKKAAEAKTEAKPAAAGARGGARGGAAGRGAPAARGRGAANTPARGGAARGAGARGASTAPGRGAARGTPAGRGGPAAKAGAPAAKSGSSGTLKPTASKSGHDNCVINSTAPASTTKPAPPTTESPAPKPAPSPSKSTPLNRKMYHPRLGLARALRTSGDIQEAQKYYNEVISMAPGVHDAYIESAEMLTKTDPLAAVDIFAKFPVPDEPSFDDAYIFGEIVRLLMKNEKYDDPRLGPNMIVYGRILGLGSLEKYVNKLEELFKAELLKTVYAGVNRKEVDDPDLQAFFKFKCWI
ncbi:uncharacterized protein [Haliotis asinina]|uniref:uncharacterized protein n=1 Tax=Haliotis asinina TaxID=109174 RepID=UPI003531EDB7